MLRDNLEYRKLMGDFYIKVSFIAMRKHKLCIWQDTSTAPLCGKFI